MLTLSIAAQLIVAASIVIVWVFRHENIVKEFEQYGLDGLTRSAVGAAKISLATLLVAGIWYPGLVLVPAIARAILMVSAQYFHFKVNNSFAKRAPSLGLLILCVFIAAVSAGYLS